jgi:hypothetical protein
MLAVILRLRLLQAARLLIQLGWWRAVLVAIFGLFSVYYAYFRLFQAPVGQTAWYWWAGLLLTIIPIHFTRPDKAFLSQLTHQSALIIFSEYVLITLPFALLLLFSPFWYITLALWGCLWLLAPVQKSWHFRQVTWPTPAFLQPSFEWAAGLRRWGLPMLLVYVLAVAFSTHVSAILLGIVALGEITVAFYGLGESVAMVQAFEQPPKQFLWYKIGLQWRLFLIITAPLLLLFLVIHTPSWHYLLLVLVATGFAQMCAVLCKYAFFEPNTDKSLVCGTYNALFFFSLVVPLLALTSAVMSVYLFRKAVRNLHTWLYAYC